MRILALLFLVSSLCQSQSCDFLPLHFDEVAPIWSHLTIDPTIIGHVDTCAEHQFRDYDGHWHFLFDQKSFITSTHLFSLTGNRYDGDDAGYLIEKIELQTGQLEWRTVVDLRTEDYRQKILHAEEKEGKLHLYGVRAKEKDMKGDGPAKFALRNSSLHFHRVYDGETGILLHETTPADNDTTAYLIQYGADIVKQYYLDDRIENIIYHRKIQPTHRTHTLLRVNIDSSGILIPGEDTLAAGLYNDQILNWTYDRQYGANVLRDTNGHYLHIQQNNSLPNEPQDFRATIMEIDAELNIIKQKDLTDVLPEVFYNLSLVWQTDDHILLRGSYNPFSFYQFMLFLDKDFNITKRFDTKIDAVSIGDNKPHQGGSEEVYITSSDFVDEGQSQVFISQPDDAGGLSIFQTFTVSRTEWLASIHRFFILENGDFLMRMIHSCYIDGSRSTNYHEWHRYSAEDIGPVSTSNLNNKSDALELYPNPARSELNLVSPVPLTGLVKVINLDGRTVLTQPMEKVAEVVLDIAKLNSGAYAIMINLADGNTISKRFVKID